MIRFFLSKRFWKTAAAVAAVVAVAIVINVLGIRALGGIEFWDAWRNHAYWYFLAWRMCVYAGLVYGWVWMRRRVLLREPTDNARARLRRAAVAAFTTILLFELAKADLLF